MSEESVAAERARGEFLFCELEIPCGGHAEVNSALLATARRAFPDAPIRLLGERRHLDAVERLLGLMGVDGVVLEESRLASTARLTLWRELRLFGGLVRRARRDGVRRIVFCSCSRRRVGWAKLVARRLPGVEVWVVLHETDYTLGFADGNALERLVHRLYYGALPANLTLLVLGPWIARHALERYPFVRPALAWMWHPYVYGPDSRDAALPGRGTAGGAPVTFAFFGVAKAMKGAADFRRLARCLSADYGSGRVRFLHLGRHVPSSLPLTAEDGIEFPAADGELTRARMAELAAGVDYAVFPYEAEAYRGRSSGALHDALAFGTPILAYRGPMFESYFAALGDVGELVDGYDELERLARRLVESPSTGRHQHQRAALRRAVEDLSCEALAGQFREPPRPG